MPSQETPGRFALPWHWLPLPPSKTKRPQAGEILKHVKEENHLAQSERLTHIQMQGSSNMPLYSIYIYQTLSNPVWHNMTASSRESTSIPSMKPRRLAGKMFRAQHVQRKFLAMYKEESWCKLIKSRELYDVWKNLNSQNRNTSEGTCESLDACW